MKKKLIRWLVKWFVVKLNLYMLWSRIHQRLFQKKRVAVPVHSSLAELEMTMGLPKWKADSWKELWDVVNHPEHSYYKSVFEGGGFDCDDYATLAAMICNRDLYPKQDAKVLSVQWLNKEGKFKGHNVCLFVYEGSRRDIEERAIENPSDPVPNDELTAFYSLGWIGNYFGGRAKLGYHGVEQIVREIVGEGQLISYFVFDWTCKKARDLYITVN